MRAGRTEWGTERADFWGQRRKVRKKSSVSDLGDLGKKTWNTPLRKERLRDREGSHYTASDPIPSSETNLKIWPSTHENCQPW